MLGKCYLPGYALQFKANSKLQGTGIATIAQSRRSGDKVWGVLYDIPEQHFSTLTSHWEQNKSRAVAVTVTMEDDGQAAKAFACCPEEQRPSDEIDFRDPCYNYREALVAAAREVQLDEDYIETVLLGKGSRAREHRTT